MDVFYFSYKWTRRNLNFLLTKNSQFCSLAEIRFIIDTEFELDVKKLRAEH